MAQRKLPYEVTVEAEGLEVWKDLRPIGPDTVVFPRFRAHYQISDAEIWGAFQAPEGEGRPELRSWAVRTLNPKTALSPATIREAANHTGAFIEAAIHRASFGVVRQADHGDRTEMDLGFPGPTQLRQIRRRQVTPALLAEVATVFGETGSVKAVERHFVVSQRTAYRYVTLARQAGLIGEGD